ncbi:MAG: flagellar basal body-associated FliL family protein [Pseudomonadota bacterium]
MARTTLIESPDAADGAGKPSKAALLKRLMRPRMLILAAVILVVLVGAGVGAWLFVLKGPDDTGQPAPADKSKAASKEQVQPAAPLEPEFADIVTLEPFERIQLKPGQDMNHVSLTLALELVSPDMKPQVLAQTERIRQVVEFEVGNMTWMVLRNPDGKLKLKFRLINSINALMPETTVRDVYFTLFLMQ